ncbi:MAG: immunoglobulin domain-containing protein, partial [Limisphaerales bacterium]
MKRLLRAAAFAALLLRGSSAGAAAVEFHSFSPPAAPLGHEVILRGRGLTNVTAVTFNGAGAPFRLLHDGALSARVPAGRVDGPVTLWSGPSEGASLPGFRRTSEPLSVVVWDATRPDQSVTNWLLELGDLTNAVDAALTLQAFPGYGVAARDNGGFFLWGRPRQGSLTNVPPEVRDIVAVAAHPSFWLALRDDGEVFRNPPWDARTPRPTEAVDLVQIVAPAENASAEFLALRRDGHVVHVSGSGIVGRLHGAAGVAQIAHGLALRRDGHVTTRPNPESTRPPLGVVQVGVADVVQPFALHRDGRVGNVSPTFFAPLGGSNVVALAGGTPRVAAGLRPDGSVWLDTRGALQAQAAAPAWLTGVRLLKGSGNHFIALAALPPRFTRAPEDLLVPLGGTVRLVAEVAGTGPLRLRWYKDGVAIPGATRPVLEFADVEIFDDGEYSCVATGPHGVAGTPPARVRVVVPPAVTGVGVAADGTVILEGVNLAAVTAVTFNGVGAFPLRATAGRLELRPPAGNTAGPIRVWIGNTA